MTENLVRTIIHEIGHYIAIMLNHQILSSGECNQITIQEEIKDGIVDYRGLTYSDVINKGNDEESKKLYLSERIAVLVYGCYLQCLFQQVTFESCFGFNMPSVNGAEDRQVYNVVFPYEVNREKRIEIYEFIGSEYFSKLMSKRSLFEPIFKLDFATYIENDENENIIKINLTKLRESLADFFKAHMTDFIAFHARINSIVKRE